jgi:uncharacterized protein (DUF58 family)
VATSRRRTFSLVPRHRLWGGEVGAYRSARRGAGTDIAGMRPYRPGDRLALIDWKTSARLSAVQDQDVFVVREYYAEEAPRVIIIVDWHPSMALYSSELPWLSKSKVAREATTAIVAATHAARGYVGYLDFAGAGKRDGAAYWLPPRRLTGRQIEYRLVGSFDAPGNTVELAIDHLIRRRHDVPAGSFVFIISDFLRPPPLEVWLRAYARNWDLVPVIVQDPVWEQSFPMIGGLLFRVADPESGRTVSVRLTAGEARERRRSNAERLQELLALFRRLRFDPVLLETSEPGMIDAAFIKWSVRRRLGRRPSR